MLFAIDFCVGLGFDGDSFCFLLGLGISCLVSLAWCIVVCVVCVGALATRVALTTVSSAMTVSVRNVHVGCGMSA